MLRLSRRRGRIPSREIDNGRSDLAKLIPSLRSHRTRFSQDAAPAWEIAIGYDLGVSSRGYVALGD